MYGNKSQMSWKPNPRTFIALAPCVKEKRALNELLQKSCTFLSIRLLWGAFSTEDRAVLFEPGVPGPAHPRLVNWQAVARAILTEALASG